MLLRPSINVVVDIFLTLIFVCLWCLQGLLGAPGPPGHDGVMGIGVCFSCS